MDNQKRVSVAFSECELEYVDDLQEEFKKKQINKRTEKTN